MRKLLKKSLACLLAAIFCVTLCVAAVPASAEAPTYATNDVVAKAGETVNIDFTVNNFANVKGAMIKFFLPEVVASITEVKINGEALAAYDAETGAGYYQVDGNSIKFLSLFGYEGELASASTLTFNVVAVIADDAAEGTYTYAAPYFSVTEDGETLVDVTGTFGKFEIAPAVVEPEEFEASFRYLINVSKAVGAKVIFTKPEAYDDFKIRVNRTTFTNKYAFTPAEEIVWTPDDAYLAQNGMFGFEYAGLALYELSMDVTLTVEGYSNGQLVAISKPVILNIADLISDSINKGAGKAETIYSEILWLGDYALKYFQKTAGDADIDTVASPTAKITTTPVATYTPVVGEPQFTGDAVKFSKIVLSIQASPSIQLQMSGISGDVLANGTVSVSYESGLSTVGTVSASAAFANVEAANGMLQIIGTAAAYRFNDIALYDSDKLFTATVSTADGTLATVESSLAIQITKALENKNNSEELNALYNRLLVFGEIATNYFGA